MVFLIFLLLMTMENTNGQDITLEISPSYPTVGDTVVVSAHLFYTYTGCSLFQQTLTHIESLTYHAEALHCIGISPAFCETTDSFEVVADSAGLYTFVYTCYSRSYEFGGPQQCNNLNAPPFTNNDTIQFLVRPVGIGETITSSASLVSVYPNPASMGTSIVMETERNKSIDIQIHDALGQSVLKIYSGIHLQGRQSYEVSCTSLPSGLYTINIRTTDSVVSHKLVIQH
jgi:hypothetical protein